MVLVPIRLALVAAAMALMAWASPAHADWRRAESPNFVVYSQGSEGELRRYARHLEIYDYILRARMGLPPAGASTKLPIYLVRGRAGLEQINPGIGEDVAGVYFAADEGVFAAAINDREQDTLFHEYYHHFSMQIDSTAGYPAWLIEGFAEYFMTAKVSEAAVMIGGYNEARVADLFSTTWLPLDVLLTKRFGEVRQGTQRDSYYPVAWFLTHWFMSDDTRRRQLGAYVRDLRQGTDSITAMEQATGLTLDQIYQQLRRYRRLTTHTYRTEFPATETTVTRLPGSADDLLLIGQRLKIGVQEGQREETAALVRRLAARHADDPFAMLQLGHAELHFGDPDAGEAILTRLLEREPDNVEALQLMASRYTSLARENPDETVTLLRQAREFLRRAYAADPTHYHTLKMLAETRQVAPDYPTENDLVAWDQAFRLAPQLPSIRLGFANALMQAEEYGEAVLLLTPLANAPHGGQAAEFAASLMVRAMNRQSPFSAEELDAASAGDVPEAGEADADAPAPSEPGIAPPQ